MIGPNPAALKDSIEVRATSQAKVFAQAQRGWPSRAGPPAGGSDSEPPPALEHAALQHRAAILRLHAVTEAMPAQPPSLLRLIGTFWQKGRLQFQWRRKYGAIREIPGGAATRRAERNYRVSEIGGSNGALVFDVRQQEEQ